jgi:hypothetical protein
MRNCDISLLFEAFDYFAAFNASYKPIFDLMYWGEATVRCQELDRSAHLVVLRSLDEYQNLVSYLSAAPQGKSYCST